MFITYNITIRDADKENAVVLINKERLKHKTEA